jgi:hypothetical protein
MFFEQISSSLVEYGMAVEVGDGLAVVVAANRAKRRGLFAGASAVAAAGA